MVWPGYTVLLLSAIAAASVPAHASWEYVPQEILERKKTGFGVPLKYWFETDWKDHTRDALLDPNAFCNRYFNSQYIRTLLETHSPTRPNYSQVLYRLLVLEEWSRAYLA